MRKVPISLAAISLLVMAAPVWAHAEDAPPIPEWVKTSAGWWAEGLTGDSEFVSAIAHLIDIGVITVDYDGEVEDQNGGPIPDWVKTSVKWWAEGATTDAEFVGAITHLIKIGLVVIEQEAQSHWDEKMAECAQFAKAYQRLDCEKAVEEAMIREQYIETAAPYQVGPVTYYYPGALLETTSGGQPLLTVRMLAINDGDSNVTLSCSGPAICNYDVTDGTTAFKYAATDFTSGSITLKPDQAREFEIIFGPNIGYGGTTFVYDSSKQYHFRISESFGSASIPLELE